VDALKRLLEAEGTTATEPAPAPPAPSGDRRSGLRRSFALGRLLSARTAHAEQEADPETDIRAMLERWRQAAEGKKMEALAEVYVHLTEDQQAAQQRYFDNVKDLRIAIENVDIAVVGDEAVVSYTRTDDFADAGTGQPMHVSVRLTKTLRRDDSGWRIAPEGE
jgi:ketosteroid isomerase-like protein